LSKPYLQIGNARFFFLLIFDLFYYYVFWGLYGEFRRWSIRDMNLCPTGRPEITERAAKYFISVRAHKIEHTVSFVTTSWHQYRAWVT